MLEHPAKKHQLSQGRVAHVGAVHECPGDCGVLEHVRRVGLPGGSCIGGASALGVAVVGVIDGSTNFVRDTSR
ncbi:hypothetical protein ATKI12_4278 [Kitasatospora sp. Ki12]